MKSDIQKLFEKLPRTTVNRLGRVVHKMAPANGLTYTDEAGKTEIITLTLRPRVVPKKRLLALSPTIRSLDHAFRKIARLYFDHPSVSDLLPFTPRELEWLACLQDPNYEPGHIISRWDANTTFGSPSWKDSFSFFEVNGVGVGGLWYGAASAELALKVITPELQKLNPHFHPHLFHDTRQLLLGSLLGQRKKLRRMRGVMAFEIQKASGSNYVEFERFAKLYQKLGHPSIVCEPTDFKLKKGELYARGKQVDVVYRDTTLLELCELEEKGHDMSALREAFRKGQILSSLEGEFDHKSVFEIFTSPDYASCFTSKEKRIFKRHILWTRLLSERKTTDSQGKKIDLLPFVYKNQADLVLKPNRLYGGQGVVFGKEMKCLQWEKKIEGGLKEPGEWVIQKLGELKKRSFFRHGKKASQRKDYYVVSGFFATDKGIGVVGRMSERTVVNVARRGGLTPILFV